jgi:hypothetical protein
MILDWYCLWPLDAFSCSVFFSAILHPFVVLFFFLMFWCTWIQKDQIKRLYSLLTIKESAANVPKNLEARRRLQFFTNSLFMQLPIARPVSEMVSFRWGLFISVFACQFSQVSFAVFWVNNRSLACIKCCFCWQQRTPLLHSARAGTFQIWMYWCA